MGGKGYAARMQEHIDDCMQTAERVTRQFDVDTFQIALHRYEKVSFGYQRIMEITELWERVRREYGAVIDMGPETDVARHHLDAELLSIAKDESKIIPCEKRYPELRQVIYEGRKRH